MTAILHFLITQNRAGCQSTGGGDPAQLPSPWWKRLLQSIRVGMLLSCPAAAGTGIHLGDGFQGTGMEQTPITTPIPKQNEVLWVEIRWHRHSPPAAVLQQQSCAGAAQRQHHGSAAALH